MRVVAAAILAVALVFRIGDALYERTAIQGTDPFHYQRTARAIASHGSYPPSDVAAGGGPSAALPPLYPYFLGAVFAVTGNSVTAARLSQAVIGTVSVALLALLALSLLGPPTALAALALASIYPTFIIAGSATLSDGLFLPLEIATILTALRAARASPRGRWLVATGVMIGLTALDRPNGALLLIPVAMILWAGSSRAVGVRTRLAPIAIVAAASLLAVTPWLIRDAVKFHAFVPITIEDGTQLAGVMNDHSRLDKTDPGVWLPASWDPLYTSIYLDRRLNEYTLNRKVRSVAFHYLGRHPAYAAKAVFYNVLRATHFGSDAYERQQAIGLGVHWSSYVAARIGFWIVAVLAILGAFTRAVRRLPRWVWVAPGLLFLSAIINGTLVRYRYPVDPYLVIAAAAACVVVWNRLTAARSSTVRRRPAAKAISR